jgi:hypothetical protein
MILAEICPALPYDATNETPRPPVKWNADQTRQFKQLSEEESLQFGINAISKEIVKKGNKLKRILV